MHISVTHSTVYRYDSPVMLEPHTFRLRPRTDASQRLANFSLQILPAPAGRSDCLDQEGNVVLEAWFDVAAPLLSIQSSFTVETLRTNPFDFLVRGSGKLPFEFDGSMSGYLDPPSDAVRVFVRPLISDASGTVMPFLDLLNRRIFEEFAYVVREDGPAHPPEQTLAERSGTCRDLAVLFCAACRTVNIPARFVSGYSSDAHLGHRAELHAWAEVYLPGGGWRGYDPSQGLAVADSHVAVAAAAYPSLAAPVSGKYRGSARSAMEFSISVSVRP